MSLLSDPITSKSNHPISNNRGLGAEIARAFAAQGSNIAINYANNASAASKLAQELESTHGVKTTTIKADAGSTASIITLVRTATQDLGGLDIVIANAGWTRFSDFADLDALTDEEWDRCWKTNVLGIKQLVASALPTFNSNAEGGVVLVTSSIAGRSIGGSSMAYSVTKAAQLHLVKCVAKTQGAKVRCNAVLPGLLLTEWGLEYGDEKIKALKEAAVLQKEVRSSLSTLREGVFLIDMKFTLLTLSSRDCRRISRTARTCSSRWQRTRALPGSTSRSIRASRSSIFEASVSGN
jgi:NAD(P)-dependent dehydrogenase (short-subunit alcohol dehydrogenase family)